VATPMPRGVRERSCPYIWRQADLQEQMVPGTCRDPVSGLSQTPGFWEYWNRCLSPKHIRCRRFRRYQRQRQSSLRRSA
jgi:hypothetical protein